MRIVRWLRNVEDRVLTALLWTIAAAVLLHDAYYLFAALSSPLLGEHGFRQTQTALTAYWARYDGLRLAYETPVLGAPWAIPFEFPLYQWIVAALFRLGLQLESAGRLVSFAFLLACIWPFAILCRVFALPRYALPLMTILFLAAPIDAFWGRAVLVETCALFLALLWLALLCRNLAVLRASLFAVAATAVAGCLAILQKSTTFPAFGLIGGCYLLAKIIASLRARDWRQAAYLLGLGAATCLVPLAVGIAWVQFTDHVKLQVPAAEWLTSQNLTIMNYGTWAQRYSHELWAALQRATKDTFGISVDLALATIVGGAIFVKSVRLPIIIGVLSFLVPFAVFTNLHIVHNYYQVANAVFLVAALAFALTGLFRLRQSILALGLLTAIVAGQLVFFANEFRPRVLADLTAYDNYRIALLAREKVPHGQAIIVDTGDWSSIINLYSQRKGIAVVPNLAPALIDGIFADPSRFLGGMKASAIVVCPPYEPSDFPAGEKLIARHVAGRRVLGSAGACRLLEAEPHQS